MGLPTEMAEEWGDSLGGEAPRPPRSSRLEGGLGGGLLLEAGWLAWKALLRPLRPRRPLLKRPYGGKSRLGGLNNDCLKAFPAGPPEAKLAKFVGLVGTLGNVGPAALVGGN